MLIRQLSLVFSRTNLDDARGRLADFLRRLLLAHLAVINSHRDGVLGLTRRAFLDNLGLTRLQVRVHANLGIVRGLLSPFDLVGNRVSLGTHTDDRVARLLGALGGHGRLAGRLTVHDLLSGSDDLSTQLALLIDDLLARLQIRIEDEFSLERNRLLQLGHYLAVVNLRTVLDDLLNRLLGYLLGGVHRGGVLLRGEVGCEFLLAVFALLDNLHLTWLQLRVHAHDRVVRQRRNPSCLVGCLSRLGADSDNLLNRLLDDLFSNLRVARLGVDDVTVDRHLLLARLAFLSDLGLARLQARVVDDLHLVRNLSLNGLSVLTCGLGTHADDLLGRLLGSLSAHLRITRRLAIHDLLSRSHNLSAKLTLLVNLLLTLFKRVIENDLSLERNRLFNLGHHSGVLSGRTVLDDLADWVLGLLLLRRDGCVIALGGEISGVGLLTRNTLLNNLDLTRLQLRVRTSLNLERNLSLPLNLLGSLRRLGTDLDHLVNRLFGDLLLNGGLAIRLGVSDLLGHRDGLLARLALGDNLRGASRQVRIELDLHTERNLRLNVLLGLTGGLGANADLRVLRGLGLLSGHGRLAVRLAVLDLLGRGHNLGTKLTLLIDDLLTLLEGVIEDDFGLKRNRLLNLGHHRGVLGRRTVLDDLADWVLGLLLLRRDRCLVTLGREVSGVGLLTRNTFLNNLDLTRLQLRVRTSLDVERDLSLPLNLFGSLRRLGADGNDLIYRLLGDLFSDLRIARLGVGDITLDGHRLLARLTLGGHLGLTGRHVRVVLNDDLVWRLSLIGLGVLTSGLGTDADLGLLRGLGLLDVDARLAVRLAVLDLLGGGNGLLTRNALFVDNLLAGLEGVVVNVLDLERDLLGLLAGQLLIRDARADLDDASDRFLGGFFLSNLSFRTLGGELSGVGLLAVLAFLDNLHLARLELWVLANLSRVRNRERPLDVLGTLGRLGADDNDLVRRLRGALPGSVLVHLLCARHTLGLNLVGASRDGVVVLVLNIERNLTLRDVDDVDRRGGVVLRAVFIGHDDWNVDLVARLRSFRRGGDDVALVIQANDPVAVCRLHLVGRVAELVVLTRGLKALALRINSERLVRIEVDVCRLLDANRRGRRTTRVDRLRRNNRLRFPAIGQLHHGADRGLGGQTTRGVNRYRDGVLVTRLGIGRRRGGNFTGLRVNGVLPAVNLLGKNRLAILVTEGERRVVRSVLNLVLDFLTRSSGLNVVVRLDVALDDDDSAYNRLWLLLAFIAVVSLDRNIEDVAFLRTLRNRGRDLTSILVYVDSPGLAVLAGEGGFIGSILEGVARRGLIGRVAAQTTLRDLGSEADACVRLTSLGVVRRDLDVHDRLELGLDLIRGLVRVGCLHLRGNDAARRDGVICLRGNLAGVIDGDGPSLRDSGLINLELGRVDRLVALHDGLGAHLGGNVLIQLALG